MTSGYIAEVASACICSLATQTHLLCGSHVQEFSLSILMIITVPYIPVGSASALPDYCIAENRTLTSITFDNTITADGSAVTAMEELTLVLGKLQLFIIVMRIYICNSVITVCTLVAIGAIFAVIGCVLLKKQQGSAKVCEDVRPPFQKSDFVFKDNRCYEQHQICAEHAIDLKENDACSKVDRCKEISGIATLLYLIFLEILLCTQIHLHPSLQSHQWIRVC